MAAENLEPDLLMQTTLRSLSVEQWEMFLTALDTIMQAQNGTVTITVRRGHVRFLESTAREELPGPKKGG